MKLKWEYISTDAPSIYRAKVPNGWLIKTEYTDPYIGATDSGPSPSPYINARVIFLPDEGHIWDMLNLLIGE